MDHIIAGCCQFSIKPADPDRNVRTVERMLAEISESNCQLAVLPEMWSCSFPYPVLTSMAEKTPQIIETLQNIAVKNSLVLVGSLPELERGSVFNTDYLIDSTGEVAGKYRKVHLFSLYGEHKHFGKGDAAPVFTTSIGKVAMMICYDLRFPEIARKMALGGARIICVSALWPLVRVEHWSLLLRARAIENQLFVVGCNGTGAEEKITWGGASAIVSPLGTVVAEAGQGQQVIVGAMGMQEIDAFRKLIPCFEDRVPEVCDSLTEKARQVP